MDRCVFCDIALGKAGADFVHKDERVVAFRDIYPQAPVHILVVPRRHIATLNDLRPQDAPLVAAMVQAAIDLARREKIDARGYRLAWNCNSEGGQGVYHIHLHLLGGKQMPRVG